MQLRSGHSLPVPSHYARWILASLLAGLLPSPAQAHILQPETNQPGTSQPEPGQPEASQAETKERPLAVAIEGVSGELLENVRQYLTITDLKGEEASENRIRRAHRQSEGEIRDALQALGHYNPEIQSRLQADEEGFRARYTIEPGPPTLVDSLELTIRGPGKEDPQLREVLAGSKLSQGERLHHGHYSQTKEALLRTAVERGYLEAQLAESEIRVMPEANRAEIRLVLDTGPAFYFGDVEVEQDILTPDLIGRMVPVSKGQRLTSNRLLDIKFALSDTDYFQQVSVNVARNRAEALPEAKEQPARAVPVTVGTEPRTPRRYRAGVGFGTDTGPRLTGNAEFRRVNRKGHQFRTDLLLSPVQQQLTTKYQIPIHNVRTDRLTFSGRVEREELGDGRTEKATLGVSEDRRWLNLQRSLYLRFALEQEEFSGEESGTQFLTPGVSLSRTASDNAMHPRLGYSLFLDTHGALNEVASDATFTQFQARARGVLPLGPRMRILLRGEAGTSFVDRVTDLPASERFFAGGSRSVRGYAFQDLGPRNASGDVVGGQHLLTGSVEVDLRVYGDWGVAGFFDAGNAANEWPPDPQTGVGGGLRWFSPIGSVRLDLAVPRDDPNRDLRIHVSIGNDL